MKTLFIPVVALAFITMSCNKPKEVAEQTAAVAEKKPPVALTLKWETDTLLTTCESVLYDKDQDILYVANINGAPDGKDGNGFISKVSLDGKITDRQWAKGLDAPKGMGLANGKLYVADIDKVREIDTKTGKLTHTYPAAGAKFLNDIATDKHGKVYISDTGGGAINTLEKGKLSIWMKDLKGPNGLFAEDGDLMMALWDAKTFNSIDSTTKQVTMRADSIDNPDGIEAIENGAYLVSSWNGMIHHIDSNGNKTLILDTRSDSVSAADIEYIKSKNLLLVPTFFKNKVMAYELSRP
jgi:DNA-binding beta-propeller fold protein YncE